MRKGEAVFIHLSAGLVIGSGLVWALMIWLVVPEDPDALVNHPWQPQMQAAHILAAPFFLFGVGMVWRKHVLFKWRGGEPTRRRSGLQLALLLPVMVFSGYFLQVVSGEISRQLAQIVHYASSIWWTLVWLRHHLSRRDML